MRLDWEKAKKYKNKIGAPNSDDWKYQWQQSIPVENFTEIHLNTHECPDGPTAEPLASFSFGKGVISKQRP